MTELDALLKNVVEISPGYVDSWGFSFSLLYATGCRHEEINPKYWSEMDDQNMILECRKHSELRIIPKSNLSPEVVSILLGQSSGVMVTSRSTLTRAFMRLSFPYRVMSGDTNIFLHSFRYNYIRKLYAETGSVVECQNMIGHKDVKNTIGYIFKAIQIICL